MVDVLLLVDRDEAAIVEAAAALSGGEPVAATVAFLLSDETSFVNGIDIPVDGGVTAALRTAGR